MTPRARYFLALGIGALVTPACSLLVALAGRRSPIYPR